MAHNFLSRLELPEADLEKSTTNYNVKELNCYTDNESKNKDDKLNEENNKENNFTETERAYVIKCKNKLLGYTGKIKCYKSTNEGILEFKIKKHKFSSRIFKDKVVNCSKYNQNLCDLLPAETVIHFNAKWSQKSNSYKVTKLWSGTKCKSLQNRTQILDESSDELHPGKVYKAIVTEVNNHSFTATVTNNSKSFIVFVRGNVYQPSFTSNCLKKKEQISLFVMVRDEVCLYVKKITEKHFTHSWYAVKAWKKTVPETKVKHKVCANNFKIGTVTDVLEGEGTLMYNGFYLRFYNFSSYLFGVNLDGINLDQIFREGDEVRFIPGSDMLIAQVWYNNNEIIDEDIYLRFTQFCLSRCVPVSTVTKLIMKSAELKKQNAESHVPVHSNSETKKSQGRKKKKKCSVVKEREKSISGMKDASNIVHPNDCSTLFVIESEGPNLQVHEHDSILPQFTDRSTQTIFTGDVTPLTTPVLQLLTYVKD